jgi:hypothetical protein
MAVRKTHPAKLDPDAREHLDILQKALRSQALPHNVDFVDILSALVLYTSLPQLEGMLREYWGYTHARDEAIAAGRAPPPPRTAC